MGWPRCLRFHFLACSVRGIVSSTLRTTRSHWLRLSVPCSVERRFSLVQDKTTNRKPVLGGACSTCGSGSHVKCPKQFCTRNCFEHFPCDPEPQVAELFRALSVRPGAPGRGIVSSTFRATRSRRSSRLLPTPAFDWLFYPEPMKNDVKCRGGCILYSFNC